MLVRRGQQPLLGEWSLPGGALELGERLEDGVRREVHEETGLDVEPEEIVAVFDHISHADDDPARVRFHYVLVDYRCRLRAARWRVRRMRPKRAGRVGMNSPDMEHWRYGRSR